MAKKFTLPRPEGGEDKDEVFFTWHNCPAGKMLKAAGEDRDVDGLLFPVGIVGEGMPSGIPFEVQAVLPCKACGKYLRAWFEWTAPKVLTLWTP